MLSYHSIDCPFCGECFEIGIDPAAQGVMIQDCDVCCRPIRLDILSDQGCSGEPPATDDPFFVSPMQRVLVSRGA